MSQEDQEVRSIVTPTRLVYEFTATGAQADFLTRIAEGRLLGHRCGSCEKVYCPPSGNCPRCATSIQVRVGPGGTSNRMFRATQ